MRLRGPVTGAMCTNYILAIATPEDSNEMRAGVIKRHATIAAQRVTGNRSNIALMKMQHERVNIL